MLALRGSELTAYHGAEHVSIGTYEHGAEREKEHERCGGHLVGPMLLSSADREPRSSPARPERLRRAAAHRGAQLLAVGVATETFGWMSAQPATIPSRSALSKPGHELQHRLSTTEPTAAQQEVADAALEACLALERRAAGMSLLHLLQLAQGRHQELLSATAPIVIHGRPSRRLR